MGSPFIQSALQNLSNVLASQAEAKRKREEEQAAIDHETYKHLLTGRLPETQAAGLAGLLETPEEKKKRKGKDITLSPAYERALHFTKNVAPKADEAQAQAAPTPPPAYAPPTGSAAMSTQSVDTGNGINMSPAASMEGSPPSEPDLGPPPTPPAAAASTPSISGPPSFSDIASRFKAKQDQREKEWEAEHPFIRAGESYKPDPILQQADYAEAAGLTPEQGQENLQSVAAPLATKLEAAKTQKEADWQHKEGMEATRQTGRERVAKLNADARSAGLDKSIAGRLEAARIASQYAAARQDKSLIAAADRQEKQLRIRASQYSNEEKNVDDGLAQADPIIDDVKGMLEEAGIQDDNSLPAAANTRFQNFLYRKGIEDDFWSEANQKIALLNLQAARAYMRGRPNQKIYEDIMKHLPNPQTDTPKMMYHKLQQLKGFSTDIRQAMESSIDRRMETTMRRVGGKHEAAPPALPLPSDPKLLKKGQQYKMKDGSVGTYNGVDGFD